MSGSTNNNPNAAQLDLWSDRDATVWGRAVNKIVDWGRALTGKSPIWIDVAQRDAQEIVNRGELAVMNSGLSQSDQKIALTMINRLETEYPRLDQIQMNIMIDRTVDYVKERAEERFMQNQMNMFTTAMLQEARPINREAGLQRLEDLALVLHNAEKHMTNGLVEADDLKPWDRVDDQMTLVCHDRDALAVAAEWGFKPTEFGMPLLNDLGTALQSDDLFTRLNQERSLMLGANDNRPSLGYGY